MKDALITVFWVYLISIVYLALRHYVLFAVGVTL